MSESHVRHGTLNGVRLDAHKVYGYNYHRQIHRVVQAQVWEHLNLIDVQVRLQILEHIREQIWEVKR